MSASQPASLKVWDPIVRLGHWLLVLGFVLAYASQEDGGDLHVVSGYVVGAVVAVRIIWGLIGSRHARFTDFLYGPAQALRYLRDLLRGRARRYIGHSPAGAVMVFLLLGSLIGTTYTGLMVHAIENQAGPLAGGGPAVAARMLSPVTTARADSDEHAYGHEEESDHGDDAAEEFWEEVHEFFANLTVLLIVLHVTGVALASRAHHENLVAAMFTGRKRGEDAQQDQTETR